jgi:hypothetical protein
MRLQDFENGALLGWFQLLKRHHGNQMMPALAPAETQWNRENHCQERYDQSHDLPPKISVTSPNDVEATGQTFIEGSRSQPKLD